MALPSDLDVAALLPEARGIVEAVRPQHACRRCSGSVVQAPAPAHLIEGR